jgi:hypothetical protein
MEEERERQERGAQICVNLLVFKWRVPPELLYVQQGLRV